MFGPIGSTIKGNIWARRIWFKASQGKKLGKHISINKPSLVAVPAIQEAESRRIFV
jgi:hypothetical protein